MTPNIQVFKAMLTKKYYTELYIAQKNNKMQNSFNKKWKFKPLSL